MRSTRAASRRRRTRAADRRGHRTGWVGLGLRLGAVAVLGAVVTLTLASAHPAGSTAPAVGPELVPLERGAPLAPPGTAAGGRPVDGIGCQAGEQVVYHVHAHLAVVVDGHPLQVPAGIGVAPPRHVRTTPAGDFVDGGSCFSWLHTHAADGIIHVESPSHRTYTLGEFFDVWHQPLSGTRVGPATGRVTVLVDGRRRHVDPRAVALTAHRRIQLDVGTPTVAAGRVAFPPGL